MKGLKCSKSEHIDDRSDDLTIDQTVQQLIQAFLRFHHKEMEAHTSSFDRRMSEGRTLLTLYAANSQGIRVSELSKLLRVTSPSVTQQLNSFEERNLISRLKDMNDRRVVKIILTEKGRLAAEEVQKDHQDFFSGLAQYLGEEDSIRLARLLHKMFNFMDEKMAGKRG